MPSPGPNGYDIAAVNLPHALGLPGSEGLDVVACLRWVDEAARLVRDKTERHFDQFEQRPAQYDHSEGIFRMMWLVTVLQRDLGVHYRQEVIELSDHAFFGNAENLFIHGIVHGKGGTCSSLPPLFAAVARRLGYPLRLVCCKPHQFARWEGRGERFNVECTSRGFVSHPDEHYLKWPVETYPEEVQRYNYPHCPTAEEEEAGFLCQRGHVWTIHGQYGEAVLDYLRGFRKAKREWVLDCLRSATARWGKSLRSQIGPGFPGLTVCNQPCVDPDLPGELQEELNYLNALESMLADPVRKAQWWEPLRRNLGRRPPGLPEWVKATYPSQPGAPLHFEPCPRPTSRNPGLIGGGATAPC